MHEMHAVLISIHSGMHSKSFLQACIAKVLIRGISANIWLGQVTWMLPVQHQSNEE